MGSLLNLDLGEPTLTQKQREEGLRNALRAERLLEYPEMKWWLEEQLQQEDKRQWERLLKAENEKLADEARGAIKVLRSTARRLQFMAQQRSKLEEQLND
jgi:hypothetical protein